MTPFHILAGLLSLAAGAVALYAAKGQRLHRESGRVFVWAMLFMSGSGALIAALKSQPMSVAGGVLTFYMVATGVLTVRPVPSRFQWVHPAAMLVALTLGLYDMLQGVGLLASAKTGAASVYLVFGGFALLGAWGDWRMLRQGGWQGARRIARHLWRMGLAMFIATASFFLGQAQLFPAPLRQTRILAIPVLLVLLAMLYWLTRLLIAQWRAPS